MKWTFAISVAISINALLNGSIAAQQIDFPCANPPVINGAIPGDTVLSDQPSFNCFAWQEFIGVNWPTGIDANPQNFGAPGSTAPVVFETYHNVHDFMLPDGASPLSDTLVGFHPKGLGDNVRALSRVAKLGSNFDPSKDINEAAPGISWLADRDGNLVWYEIFVNDAEYQYIIENELYNSEQQYQHIVERGGHLTLPKGTAGGTPGAMEFKAAWLTVNNPEDTKWNRYKLSEGAFCTRDENDEPFCTKSTIALIGLHILHKTASQPSWTWATFEHIDNVPDQSQVDSNSLDREYTFYANSCKTHAVPEECTVGHSVAQTSCEANIAPAYAIGPFKGGMVEESSPCQPYPIRATRLFPIPDSNENPIVQTNKAAQNLIRNANPESVFQYYQLINILWSDSPVDENAGPEATHAPLSKTAFRPELTTFPVSNPVLETYVQNTSCLECHSNAAIAGSPLRKDPGYAADYSFIFGMAGPKPDE